MSCSRVTPGEGSGSLPGSGSRAAAVARRSKQSVFVFPSAERGNQFVPTLPLDEAGDVLAVPGDHIGPGLVQQQPAASTGHGVDTRA